MSKKLPKQEAVQSIEDFFSHIREKSSQNIKKILKVAMAHNIKLGGKRKLFCRECFSVFDSSNSEIRIRRGMKIIRCKNCNILARWKIRNKSVYSERL